MLLGAPSLYTSPAATFDCDLDHLHSSPGPRMLQKAAIGQSATLWTRFERSSTSGGGGGAAGVADFSNASAPS